MFNYGLGETTQFDTCWHRTLGRGCRLIAKCTSQYLHHFFWCSQPSWFLCIPESYHAHAGISCLKQWSSFHNSRTYTNGPDPQQLQTLCRVCLSASTKNVWTQIMPCLPQISHEIGYDDRIQISGSRISRKMWLKLRMWLSECPTSTSLGYLLGYQAV